MSFVESLFVTSLFVLYLILWRIRRKIVVKNSGTDPEVLNKSTSSIQHYMNIALKSLTIYAVIIIVAHTTNIQYGSLFSRFDGFSGIWFDVFGYILGLGGLSLCLIAQIEMGNSWRVGIDEKTKTDLVTTGIFKAIRNPTYTGLYLLNAGVWIIWPTWTVFLLNILFVVFLDLQVRCEEDFLYSIHGEQYIDYKRHTKRYIPFVY